MHSKDGKIKELTTPLDGSGIQPVTIILSLPNVNLSGQAGSEIRLPIQLLDPSVTDVASIKVSMNINTDLLEPESFDMTGSVITGANISPLTISKTGVTIDMQFPPQQLSIGLLGTVLLHPYVSDSENTSITLTEFLAFNESNTRECLPTAIVTPPQVITSFSLDKECGDSTLLHFIRTGSSGFEIEDIRPNPTSSQISVTLRIPSGYNNDAIIEIFDALGNRVQSEKLIISDGERRMIRKIDLQGASGLRFVRVRTPGGVSVSQSLIFNR